MGIFHFLKCVKKKVHQNISLSFLIVWGNWHTVFDAKRMFSSCCFVLQMSFILGRPSRAEEAHLPFGFYCPKAYGDSLSPE
jgi:hypothetical protein